MKFLTLDSDALCHSAEFQMEPLVALEIDGSKIAEFFVMKFLRDLYFVDKNVAHILNIR